MPLAKVCTRSAPFYSTIPNRVILTPQLLAFATEELSLRVGETLAGLINATLVRASFHPKFSPSSVSQNAVFACRVTREFCLLNIHCGCVLIGFCISLFCNTQCRTNRRRA